MPITATKYVKLPFSHASLKHSGLKHITGNGMGSVLLRTGGGGAGSSYRDIDDYIATTGINPYSRASASASSGSGLKSITDKLSKLGGAKEVHSKRKNIVMSL